MLPYGGNKFVRLVIYKCEAVWSSGYYYLGEGEATPIYVLKSQIHSLVHDCISAFGVHNPRHNMRHSDIAVSWLKPPIGWWVSVNVDGSALTRVAQVFGRLIRGSMGNF